MKEQGPLNTPKKSFPNRNEHEPSVLVQNGTWWGCFSQGFDLQNGIQHCPSPFTRFPVLSRKTSTKWLLDSAQVCLDQRFTLADPFCTGVCLLNTDLDDHFLPKLSWGWHGVGQQFCKQKWRWVEPFCSENIGAHQSVPICTIKWLTRPHWGNSKGDR